MKSKNYPRTIISIFALSIPILATGGINAAAGAERFAAKELGQNGRITLTPGFSPDGKTIYFAQSECKIIWECPQRLKYSTLTSKGWSKPQAIKATGLNRVDYPSVTPDGRYLLFSMASQRGRHQGQGVLDDFDIYQLDITRPNAMPVPIDEPDINRIRGGKNARLRFINNETAPIMTKNGDLFFWTERADGLGERDIYQAQNDGKGGFQKPRAMPEPINSASRDDGSWINPEGTLMLLSYNSRGGSGGSDLFVSFKIENTWSVPVNLGKTVNSSYEEFAGSITPDGKHLVFSSTRPYSDQSAGLIQIWHVPINEIPALQFVTERTNSYTPTIFKDTCTLQLDLNLMARNRRDIRACGQPWP
jgi:hypothetical protein